jgi:hypothetical protein
LRRGNLLLLVSVCVTGLFLGSSYLGESSAQASDGRSGHVARLIETRESLSDAVVDNGREILYGLERVKDELEDLLP